MVTTRMEPGLVTDPGLLGVLAELRRREPRSAETGWQALYHQGTIVS